MKQLLDYLEDEDEFEDIDKQAEMILDEPYKHHCLTDGKKLRNVFIFCMLHWYPITSSDLERLLELVDQLHNVSLVLDDVVDGSLLRRGIPAAYTIYGVPRTVQAINYVLFYRICQKVFPNWRCLSYTLMVLKGQIMDNYYRDQLVCPTIDEYYDMVFKKTSVVFIIICQTMKKLSASKIDTYNLCKLFGQCYQVRDDYLNFRSKQMHREKGFCEDLTEGKFSFPVIYAINKKPEDTRVLDIVKQRTTDVEEKKKFVVALQELGSFDESIKEIAKLKQDIVQNVNDLGGNPRIIQLLDGLTI